MSRRQELEQECVSLATAQWGVLTHAQAVAVGMTMSSIQRRCQAGAWLRVHRGTYRLRDWPPSWEQSLAAACLWADGAACRRSAARLWELGCENAPIEVVTTDRGLSTDGVIVHHTDTLPLCDVTNHRGIRTTTASRTLIDLGAAVSPAHVERALEAALRLRLTTAWHVVSRLDDLGACGRNGVGVIREVLRARDPRLVPTESELEARLWEIIASSHLPLPERQSTIADEKGTVGRHDFVYPHHRLVIEAQSARWHLSQDRWRRDMERRNRLMLDGWKVLEIGWQDVIRRPRQVIRQIEAALFNVKVEKRPLG